MHVLFIAYQSVHTVCVYTCYPFVGAKCDYTKLSTVESSSVKWGGESQPLITTVRKVSARRASFLDPSIDLQNNGCSGVETVHYPQCLSVHWFMHPQSLKKGKKTGHSGVDWISSLSSLCPLSYPLSQPNLFFCPCLHFILTHYHPITCYLSLHIAF